MVYLRKTEKKGFTLVELIAVVAIIAIMAGIAIPLISHYVQSANADADAATAYSIENALKVAASEIKTGRATQTLSNDRTVKNAILNMKQSTSILTPIQSGYAFYYNSASQTVGAFLESAPPAGYTYTKLTVNIKLVNLGLISP